MKARVLVALVFLFFSKTSISNILKWKRWSIRGHSNHSSALYTVLQQGNGRLETAVLIPDGHLLDPRERMFLTANGNLQRLLSAYYNAPIRVDVRRCEDLGAGTFERDINLVVGNHTVCNAVGKVKICSQDCLEAVRSGRVGIGQLLERNGAIPSFRLLRGGKKNTSGGEGTSAPVSALWREYELSTPQLHCAFTEHFAPGFLDLDAQWPS